MKTREQVGAALRTVLEPEPGILAAWEGGSVATGFADEYSDLDLMIVCEDDRVERCFELIEGHLAAEYGIERRYRVPEPGWHGFSQCFYRIRGVPELFYLDISVVKKSVPDKLTERDRHGIASVWFEKTPVVDTRPSSPEARDKRAAGLYRYVVETDFVIIAEFRKNLARGQFCEAFPSYYQFVTRQLGTLLNLKYRPEKVDFGIRYAAREYAPEDAALLESLLKCPSLEALGANFEKALARYEALKIELKRE